MRKTSATEEKREEKREPEMKLEAKRVLQELEANRRACRDVGKKKSADTSDTSDWGHDLRCTRKPERANGHLNRPDATEPVIVQSGKSYPGSPGWDPDCQPPDQQPDGYTSRHKHKKFNTELKKLLGRKGYMETQVEIKRNQMFETLARRGFYSIQVG